MFPQAFRSHLAADFEDRVMFGTDQLLWPKLMAYSINIIQNADYLTPQQKRDLSASDVQEFRAGDGEYQLQCPIIGIM
jgi:hypothetical protein